MELIKRKISLSSLTDLGNGVFQGGNVIDIKGDKCIDDKTITIDEKYNPNPNYGKLYPYINFTICIVEDYNNIGLYNDFDFIETTIPSSDEFDFSIRKSGVRLEKYLTTDKYLVQGNTDTRLDEISYYGDLILNKNYSNDTYSFTGALSKTTIKVNYIINGENSNGYIPNTGVDYIEYFDLNRVVYDNDIKGYIEIPLVEFKVSGQGWTANNSSLAEIVKDDMLTGIFAVQPTINELEINRSTYSVFENHYILGEVNTLEDLTNYRNNYFKL